MTRNEARTALVIIVVALIACGCNRSMTREEVAAAKAEFWRNHPTPSRPIKTGLSIAPNPIYARDRPPLVSLPVEFCETYGEAFITGKATLKTSSGVVECDLIQETIRVLNEDTGLPVWGAEVRVKSLGVETYFKTDKNGYCEIVYARPYASLRIRAHHCEIAVGEILPRGTRTFTVHYADIIG